jgi:hypothetical protein
MLSLGQQGGVWASSAGYSLSPEEQTALTKVHNDSSEVQAHGVKAAGCRPTVCQNTSGGGVSLSQDESSRERGERGLTLFSRRRVQSPDSAGRGHQDCRGQHPVFVPPPPCAHSPDPRGRDKCPGSFFIVAVREKGEAAFLVTDSDEVVGQSPVPIALTQADTPQELADYLIGVGY